MRMRLDTLLVGHQRHALEAEKKKVDALFDEMKFRGCRKTVLIDNFLPRVSLESRSDGSSLIGGDNAFREFSGWDRGLVHLERVRSNPDLIHFATTAFAALYTGYLPFFDDRILEASWRAGAVVGHFDFYEKPIEVLGHQSQHWLRTAYFFMPLEASRTLRSLVSFEDRAALFTGNPEKPFRRDAPICRRYQSYILSWLTGEGTGGDVVWHSRFDLNEETLPLFEDKTVAILNEHLLGVRLRQEGIPVVDVDWLAGQLSAREWGEVPWSLDWKEQVAGRSVGSSLVSFKAG